MDDVERNTIQDALQNIRMVRAEPWATWPAGTLERADALLTQVLGEAPFTPPARPPLVAPVESGAVYGVQKWLGHSLGCDLFLRRGAQVVAPAAGVIKEVIPGDGLHGGDEL